MRSPDGNVGVGEKSNNNDDKKINKSQDLLKKEEEDKTVSEKIHDALQDWSNGDQRDQEFDDTRP